MLHLTALNNMHGRLYAEITRDLPLLLTNCSIIELKELQASIEDLIRRRKFVPLDIEAQIAKISSDYGAIDFGETSADAKTLSAVTLVDKMNFDDVIEAVVTLVSSNARN